MEGTQVVDGSWLTDAGDLLEGVMELRPFAEAVGAKAKMWICSEVMGNVGVEQKFSTNGSQNLKMVAYINVQR